VRLHELEPLPDWRDYDLMVVMGGGMSVCEEDAHPWLVTEKRAIREAVGAGQPYFGVCLGSQLLAASLGARVYRALAENDASGPRTKPSGDDGSGRGPRRSGQSSGSAVIPASAVPAVGSVTRTPTSTDRARRRRRVMSVDAVETETGECGSGRRQRHEDADHDGQDEAAKAGHVCSPFGVE
jgi:hypothetical protein